MTTQIGPENKFKFNGKELDDDFGLQHYDFHARAYNPQLGRMNGVDPLAKFELTPTHFCSNNPINRIDPTGMSDFTTEENKLGGGPPDWLKNLLSPHMDNGFKVFNLHDGGGFSEAKDETPEEKESRIAGGNVEALASSSHEGGPGESGRDGKVDRGSGGGIMAATLAIGAATAEFPPAAAMVLGVGTAIATGVAVYNILNPNLAGTHTTYQHPSQSPLNNRPKGFNPREPNPNLNNWTKGALIGLGVYRLYKTYTSHIENLAPFPTPAVDNTYVVPKFYPYAPK